MQPKVERIVKSAFKHTGWTIEEIDRQAFHAEIPGGGAVEPPLPFLSDPRATSSAVACTPKATTTNERVLLRVQAQKKERNEFKEVSKKLGATTVQERADLARELSVKLSSKQKEGNKAFAYPMVRAAVNRVASQSPAFDNVVVSSALELAGMSHDLAVQRDFGSHNPNRHAGLAAATARRLTSAASSSSKRVRKRSDTSSDSESEASDADPAALGECGWSYDDLHSWEWPAQLKAGDTESIKTKSGLEVVVVCADEDETFTQIYKRAGTSVPKQVALDFINQCEKLEKAHMTSTFGLDTLVPVPLAGPNGAAIALTSNRSKPKRRPSPAVLSAETEHDPTKDLGSGIGIDTGNILAEKRKRTCR